MSKTSVANIYCLAMIYVQLGKIEKTITEVSSKMLSYFRSIDSNLDDLSQDKMLDDFNSVIDDLTKAKKSIREYQEKYLYLIENGNDEDTTIKLHSQGK